MRTSGRTGHVGIVVSKEMMLIPATHTGTRAKPVRVIEIIDQMVDPQMVLPQRVWISLDDAKVVRPGGRLVITRPTKAATLAVQPQNSYVSSTSKTTPHISALPHALRSTLVQVNPTSSLQSLVRLLW